jgi:sugar O-acyltransferase (sialic acid O-acetyltransferase NeuD family)
MAKVVVFGTGSFAECVNFYLTHDSPHEVVAFTVHRDRIGDRRELAGLPVVAFEDVARDYPPGDHQMFVAVGYAKLNRVRACICQEAKALGYELLSYVCSKATTWGDTQIGENCFIFEDNTIQPFVTIGDDCVLWSGNHIGHHARIGDHCFITSHVVVSGHVRVGSYCFIGVNATLRDDISIGDANVIGAGALIMKSTRDGEVYAPQRDRPHRASSDEIGM